MSKKVFTLIAVLVMAAMILSACGAPATQSPAPAETQPPAAEATEPPAEATEPPLKPLSLLLK